MCVRQPAVLPGTTPIWCAPHRASLPRHRARHPQRAPASPSPPTNLPLPPPTRRPRRASPTLHSPPTAACWLPVLHPTHGPSVCSCRPAAARGSRGAPRTSWSASCRRCVFKELLLAPLAVLFWNWMCSARCRRCVFEDLLPVLLLYWLCVAVIGRSSFSRLPTCPWSPPALRAGGRGTFAHSVEQLAGRVRPGGVCGRRLRRMAAHAGIW